jgi:hypothetical protein
MFHSNIYTKFFSVLSKLKKYNFFCGIIDAKLIKMVVAISTLCISIEQI